VPPKLHPCRPLTSGLAGRRAGPPAAPLDRNAGGPRPGHPKAFSPDASILNKRKLRQKLAAVLALIAIYRHLEKWIGGISYMKLQY
jgi:hypothetical protein